MKSYIALGVSLVALIVNVTLWWDTHTQRLAAEGEHHHFVLCPRGTIYNDIEGRCRPLKHRGAIPCHRLFSGQWDCVPEHNQRKPIFEEQP